MSTDGAVSSIFTFYTGEIHSLGLASPNDQQSPPRGLRGNGSCGPGEGFRRQLEQGQTESQPQRLTKITVMLDIDG
jgi:hypothetical protein